MANTPQHPDWQRPRPPRHSAGLALPPSMPSVVLRDAVGLPVPNSRLGKIRQSLAANGDDSGAVPTRALLALWLAREGVAVLLHQHRRAAGAGRSAAPSADGAAAVMLSLGIAPTFTAADVVDRWARREPALIEAAAQGSRLAWPAAESPDAPSGEPPGTMADTLAGGLRRTPGGVAWPLQVLSCSDADTHRRLAHWARRSGTSLILLAGAWPGDTRHCPRVDVWIGGCPRPDLGCAAFDAAPATRAPMPSRAGAAAAALYAQGVLSGERPMPEPLRQLVAAVSRTMQALHPALAASLDSCL